MSAEATIDPERNEKLEMLLRRLRAWQLDPSNVNWQPVQAVLNELRDLG